MSEQHGATITEQGTTADSHAPVGGATGADVLVSTYPRKRSRTRWVALGSIIVLVVAGLAFGHYLSGFESTDDAQVDVHLLSSQRSHRRIHPESECG